MINKERIKIFFERQQKVHISCSSFFYNGLIIEFNDDKNFLILKDIKLGAVPVMFEDISLIEPFVEKEE